MNQIDPSPAQLASWLKQLTREDLQSGGWIKINERFPGITSAVAPFLRQQFTSDKEYSAAYDGFTLALLALAHSEDLAAVAELFRISAEQSTPSTSAKETRTHRVDN